MQKRVMTAQATRDEIVQMVTTLNGTQLGEITKEQAWDIVEELFAQGCSVRWTESGYTVLWHGQEITCWGRMA